MKNRNKRLPSLVLALLIATALLTSCGTPQSGDTGEPGAQVTLGRYVEEQLALPENFGQIILLDQTPDGNLVLIGNQNQEFMPPYHYWVSRDSGSTWQEEPPVWWDEVRDFGILSAALAPDGGIFLNYDRPEEDELTGGEAPAGEASEEAPEERELRNPLEEADPEDELIAFDPDAYWDDYVPPEYFLGYGDGAAFTELDLQLPAGEWGSNIQAFAQLENGDFFVGHYFDFMHVDGVTGQSKGAYEFKLSVYPGCFVVFGNSMALCEGDNIALYDLETGERTGEVPGPQNPYTMEFEGSFIGYNTKQRAIALDREQTAFYICDSGGIYRSLLDGSTAERLLDGALVSLGMPTFSVVDLFVQEDGSFLVLAYTESEGFQLLRYVYDAGVPAVPGTELVVYSLEDNSTVRQAIGTYQRLNPDVKVTFQVGMADDSGLTVADAMRTLSTELLAGYGPDIMVLDGLPVDAYIRQNTLLDLSGYLDPLIKNGELVEHVANSYRRESALYALPARFSVPMLLAPDAGLEAVTDIASLAEYLNTEDMRMNITQEEVMLEELYSLMTPLWFAEDGALDREALRQSLADLTRIAQADAVSRPEQLDSIARLSLTFNAVSWSVDNISAVNATLHSLKDAAAPYEAIQRRGEGGLVVMPNGLGGVFEPSTILGVNASGGNTEIAADFVRCVVGYETQRYGFDDGVPVNWEAIRQNMESPYEEGQAVYYSVGLGNDDSSYYAMMEVAWTTPEFMEGVVRDITSITTPSPRNLVVKEMLTPEAYAYFKGEKSLEDAVNDFAQKYSLYQAEQN